MAEFCGLDLGPTYGRHPIEFIDRLPRRTPEQCLKELKSMLKERPDLVLLSNEDKFLRRFLMARKDNVDESFRLCVNYHLYRLRHPELFARFCGLDVLIQQALRDGFPFVLPDRDRKGRCILVFLSSRWNHNMYSLTVIFRSLLLTLEELIDDPVNQMRGFVVITDWTEFSFKNSLTFNPGILKTVIEGLQDCFPARIKGVHFINQPWYVETAITLVKPFLKDKSKNKIHLHGNNLSNLHEFVHPDILPPELGGDGPALDASEWTQKIIDIALADADSQMIQSQQQQQQQQPVRKSQQLQPEVRKEPEIPEVMEEMYPLC